MGREGVIKKGTAGALSTNERFLAGCRVEPHMMGRRAAGALVSGLGMPNYPNDGLAERVPVNAKLGFVVTDHRLLVFHRGPLGGFKLHSEYLRSEVKSAGFVKERLGRGTLMLEFVDESTALTTATEADDAESVVGALEQRGRPSGGSVPDEA